VDSATYFLKHSYLNALMVPYSLKNFPCKDRFGTYRAVFLAYDTWQIHGPWKASSVIHKCHADSNGSLFFIGTCSHPFFEGYGPNSGGWTNISACDTVVLTSAGTDPEIEGRCPECLKTGFKPCRMNDIGGTNTHALATFDASFQKFTFYN
jgi:hypothetical protein